MSRFVFCIFASLILLHTAYGCGTAKPHLVIAPQQVLEVDLTGVPYDLPAPRGSLIGRAASILTDGVKIIAGTSVDVAEEVPHHAANVPDLAMGTIGKGGEAANHGAIKVKAAAQEGVQGFSAITSFLLRIAYSSFSALVSGILRF